MIDAYHELIDALSHTAAQIQEITEGVDTAPAVAPGTEWGPAEILKHLVTVEQRMRGRMQLMLAQETPYLRPGTPEPALTAAGEPVPLRPILEEFANERAETLSFLVNLALKQWERTGIHDRWGEVSIEDLAERLTDHDAEHLTQFEQVIAQG